MQPTRSASDTAEYRRNFVANEMVNALYALDHGWRGQGVTVGVLDDGVNTALPAFEGQISALSKDFGYVTEGGVRTKRNVLGDEQSNHGTAVAGIIAARGDGSGTVGLAPDAKIAILRTSDYDADTKTEQMFHDIEAVDYAASVGIKIVNRSLASSGPGLGAAVTRFAATGGLLVNAAGNSGQANPIDAFNVTDANRDGWLFVVALSADPRGYALAGYSNAAGDMADRTVSAIGTNTTVGIDGAPTPFSGTSSATPQVSALAALILSKWPQLSGKQAGAVILNTAKDIGAPGTDPVFGRGLIDVQAALMPVQPMLSNGATATSLAGSAMAVPAAMDAGSLQTALSDVTVLDAYGRDFSGSIAGLVVQPEGGRSRWLRQRVSQMASGGVNHVGARGFDASLSYANFRTGPGEREIRSLVTSGEFGYQKGATGIRVGFNAQDSLQSDMMGLAPFADGILAYAPQASNSVEVNRWVGRSRVAVRVSAGSMGKARAQAATASFDTGALSLRASWIREEGSIMGIASEGGLALGRGATTAMFEAHRTADLSGGWSLEGYGSLGLTWLAIDPTSVVTGASALLGSRLGVQANGPAFGGIVSFGIAQPLRIERGQARLTVGTGYDLGTQSLVYGARSANLASGERRLQLTTGFAREIGASSLRLGVMRDVVDGSQRALVGYRRVF